MRKTIGWIPDLRLEFPQRAENSLSVVANFSLSFPQLNHPESVLVSRLAMIINKMDTGCGTLQPQIFPSEQGFCRTASRKDRR
jgi:hypothetical protein